MPALRPAARSLQIRTFFWGSGTRVQGLGFRVSGSGRIFSSNVVVRKAWGRGGPPPDPDPKEVSVYVHRVVPLLLLDSPDSGLRTIPPPQSKALWDFSV